MSEGRRYFLVHDWAPHLAPSLYQSKGDAMARDAEARLYLERYPERVRTPRGVYEVYVDELELCGLDTLGRFLHAEKMMMEWCARAESLQRSLR